MKTKRKFLALGAFFVAITLALAVAGCGGSGIPSGSVAVMAGNPISQKAWDHWMYVAAKGQAQSPTAPVVVPNDPPQFTNCIAQIRAVAPTYKSTAASKLRTICKGLFASMSGQVMDFLIRAYWYQAEAHKLGIKVTDAQIQKALQTAKRQQFQNDSQYQSFLTASGQTTQDILFRVRVNQLYTKLTAKYPTTVTPAAIAAYYNSHKSQFGTPQSRNLRIVLAKNQADATAALNALKHGQGWATVTKKYSIDPTTRNSGGLLTGVTAGQQDAALSKTAFSAPLNKLQGPIKGQFGYYVLEVIKVVPASQRSLAQSTALIKQTLASQLQTAAQTKVDAQAKKTWLGQTHCVAQYAMADCSGYKAPKSSSSTTAAG